jgi:BlaI family penicillinase repressor
MKTVPRISEAEWAVMKVVWEKHPAAAHEVIAALASQEGSAHPKTVRTLLGRLVKKKALGYRKEGRGYRYWPLVTEKDCQTAASRSFLERVFGGSLRPMLAHFVEHEKLSPEEIRELKRLLDHQ